MRDRFVFSKWPTLFTRVSPGRCGGLIGGGITRALIAVVLLLGLVTTSVEVRSATPTAGGEAGNANGPSVAVATPEPESSAQAIEQLGATEWAVRDAAQTYLLGQPAQQRSDIEQKLLRTEDPEVALRLQQIAIHLFLKAQTRFEGQASLLGISLYPEPIRMGARGDDVRMAITVMELQPGFPAAEILRAGDRIVGVNNRPFGIEMTVERFRQHVNTSQPGQQMNLLILRGKDEKRVNVTLAGVPEQGIASLSDYMQNRNLRARLYTQELVRRQGEKLAGVVIPDAVNPGALLPHRALPGD